ncbi:hypothetical protein V5O48_014470, partial [Marasmius crinis-equi]
MAPNHSRLTRSDKEFSPYSIVAKDLVVHGIDAINLLERAICNDDVFEEDDVNFEVTEYDDEIEEAYAPDITPLDELSKPLKPRRSPRTPRHVYKYDAI